jgi:hypothetical protein
LTDHLILQEKFTNYERNYWQLRCGKPDVMVMLHDLVLSNCQFPARQAADLSVSATRFLKKTSLFSQFVRNVFVPTGNEHVTKQKEIKEQTKP